jgi:CDP-glycerol glycerophosphotransferase
MMRVPPVLSIVLVVRRQSVRRIRSASRLPRRVLVRARSWGLRRYYAAQLRRPMDDRLAVYAAYWYTAYSCNPRAIYEKARELAPWLEGVWVVDADSAHALPPGVRHVIAGTHDYYRTMARAKYFINNVNFPNDIRKRPGQVHVQTHHGTPLKTMGMDLVNAPFSRARMNFPRLLNRVARWDFSISANSFSTEIWERVYPSGRYETLETGYPRNDVLANASAADTARLRAELGIEDGQKAVLYAPTHREYRSEFVPVLDVERLARELGPDFVILMRPHYFYASQPIVGGVGSSRVIDVAAHPSIEELCVASDVLVTDYSSLMFDYAVLDRPIVIYAPDWAIYQTLRGVYFDLMAEPPGAVSVTEDELTQVLRSGRAWDDDSAQVRGVFRAKYCSLEDGRAAERVVRRLWPDGEGPVPARLLTTRVAEEEERNGQRSWLRIVTTTPRPGRRGRAQRHESFHQHPGSGRFSRPPA